MKNRLKFVLLLLFFVPFSYLIAQEYFFGIKGGINLNTIGDLRHYGTNNGGGINANPTITVLFKAEKEIGYQYGFFAEVDFGKIFVRPEFNMASLKNSYPLAVKPAEWSAKRNDIDILIGTHLTDYLSFYAGPVYSTFSDVKLEGTETAIKFDKNAVGLSLGILLDYGRFGLDLRYEIGANDIKEQEIDMYALEYGTNRGKLETYNSNLISINLNIKLFGYDPGGMVNNKRSTNDWRNHRNLR